MKVVKVEILPAKDGEIVTATIYEQTKEGQTWKDGDKYTVKSGTPEAVRSILLEDNERVIVEGAATTMMVVDPQQSSAHEVPIPEPEPEPVVEELKAPKSKGAAQGAALEPSGAKAPAEPTPTSKYPPASSEDVKGESKAKK